MSFVVSVIVPTFKRDSLLDRCLAALLSQDLPPDCYEIIVSDNAASQTTRQLVENWNCCGGPSVTYLSAPFPRGPAAARNAGWRLAQSPIIAFTDDDCIPASSWLRFGLLGFDEGIAGVWGKVVVPIPKSDPTDYEVDAARLQDAEFVNANCFYRRKPLADVGGFDERFETAWREDSDLFFRLLETGRKLSRRPQAVVIHPPRPARWGVSLFQQKKSMFNALLYKKHPALYRERIQPSPPWSYYLSVFSLVLAIGGIMSGSAWMSWTAAGLWLLMTVRFCARRLAGTSHLPRHVLEMLVTSALIPPVAVFWRLRGALRFRVWFL